jgi:integrase
VEFLALTGQRREEVNQIKWNEIDEETQTWCIPAARSKNGKAHIVHLSEHALAVIQGRPRVSEFVFATSMGKHFQAFAKGKRKLDDLCDIKGWRLHDLRRTVVSGMARRRAASCRRQDPQSPIGHNLGGSSRLSATRILGGEEGRLGQMGCTRRELVEVKY